MIPLPGFLAPYRLLLVVIAFAATFAAGGATAWKIQGWRYGEQIEAMKAEAATALNAAIEAARLKEKQNAEHTDSVERKYVEMSAENRKLASANRRLASELGGLRDPYAAPASCVSGTSEATGSPDGAAVRPSGLLSERASEFLLGFAESADDITAYAWACHEWAIGLNRKGRDDE